jgi:N-alpha-acetyltransferase 15/16, NatA auxiliary subunit
MQSLLYLIEEGNAQHRNGKLGLALKKYAAIQKVSVMFFLAVLFAFIGKLFQVFNDIEDDQYDFHSYSLRKFTVNIYLK